MLPNVVSETVNDRGAIDPKKIAAILGITLNELGRVVHVHRNTLNAPVPGPRATTALTPLLKILAMATEMSGSEQRAVAWFKFNPILSMGSKTPMEHVQAGNASVVLTHLEDVLNGVYA